MAEFDLRHALGVAARVDGLDAKLVALLHDGPEDGDCSIEDLTDAELPEDVIEAVRVLTRGEETYADYIDRINASGNDLAIYVKLADLEANLDRMDEEHDSLRGRYQTARLTLARGPQAGEDSGR